MALTATEILKMFYRASDCCNGAEDARTEYRRLMDFCNDEQLQMPAVKRRIAAYMAIIIKVEGPAAPVAVEAVEPVAEELVVSEFEANSTLMRQAGLSTRNGDGVLYYATVDCAGHYLNGKRLKIRAFLGNGRVALIAPGCEKVNYCDVELGPLQYDNVRPATWAEVRAARRIIKRNYRKNPPLSVCPRRSAAEYIQQMLSGETVKDLFKGWGETMRYLRRAVETLNWNRVRVDGLPRYNFAINY